MNYHNITLPRQQLQDFLIAQRGTPSAFSLYLPSALLFLAFLCLSLEVECFNITKSTKRLIIALTSWTPVKYTIIISIVLYFKDIFLANLNYYIALDCYSAIFICLFGFKFIKIFIHLIGRAIYTPYPILESPTITSADVTVLIPSVGDFQDEFRVCLQTILACNPQKVIIITVGSEKRIRAQYAVDRIADPRVSVIVAPRPNKREQLLFGFSLVTTRFIAFADDHVFWPKKFLQSALAPFENPLIGHVGTVKRVARTPFDGRRLTWSEDILNFLATIYLERHNYECTASVAVDGGLFVVSGRTAIVRSSIVQKPEFITAFSNEFWLGAGPMNVDDDNFITRYMVKNGFKTWFQNDASSLMGTTLGSEGGWTKFWGQLQRWARTTVRSNTVTLFVETHIYESQPWCVYAVYFSSLVNFALPWDLGLLYTLHFSKYNSGLHMKWLVTALIASKLIKPFSHYKRHPKDFFLYFFVQVAFGYFHGIVKLYALLTCRDTSWTGRNLGAITAGTGDDSDSGEDINRFSDEYTRPEMSQASFLHHVPSPSALPHLQREVGPSPSDKHIWLNPQKDQPAQSDTPRRFTVRIKRARFAKAQSSLLY